MMRRSLRTRFAVILSGLMAALLLVVAGTRVFVRARDQRTMLESHAEGFAQTTNTRLCDVWRLYYRSGSYKFREIVRQMMKMNEDLHRLLILSVSGEVLYDSFESADLTLLPDRPKRVLVDPELISAAARPELWKKQEKIPGVGEVLLIGSPYFEEWGRHPYSVLYVFSYDKMQDRVLESLKPTLVLMLAALLVVGGVSFWLAGRVTRPILELTEGVRLFSEGRDHRLIEIRTEDELEELGDTFNRMAERIRQQVEKLENANKELATLDRMKTDLLANVSHELRTPLAAIRGYVEFIQEGQLGPISDAQRKGLDVCLRNAERLTKTINMLLDFSRMELGRVTIRPAPFQIGRLVTQVVSGVESEARKKKIRLVARVPRELKPVDGDRDRLTQVLENLITNAIKFTPEGGTVEVSARLVTPDAGGPSKVEISVADSGAGIPPEERRRIFDKFYQSDATATRKFGGIGLGLAIVKSILDAHGSEIVVEERPGGGSVFRFALPAVEARTESGIFEGFLPVDGGAAEILAIDDDADFLAIIRETLTKQGFTVRTASSAAEGLQAATERPPKLILLDIRLPDRDGLDLLHSLKEDPATRDVPILVVSVVDERLEGLRLGAIEYLVKPVDRAKLVEAATRALGRSPASSGRFEPSPRVLVVDDEEEVRQLLARALRVNGFRVETAGSGTEALEKARLEPPDLLLLDLWLPDMPGWDVMQRLKAIPECAAVPVVVLTAHSGPEEVKEGERLGVDGFLAKPVDMTRILDKIKTLLAEPGNAA
jgi:signal transduction histidine kinase/DNA-binding response OmpR family regulator